jgi:hypothetical protein
MLVIGAWIVGGLIWLIGSGTTLSDLLDNGKSLKQYREKYGHDLGMLVCCLYRGGMVAAWPVMGLGGFGVGLVRDSVRLITGRPKNIDNEK